MKYLLPLIITLTFVQAKADIPYEAMQRWSKAVSKIALAADGLVYNNGKVATTVGFSEVNFELLFNTGKATLGVYQKTGGKELMYLTEGIDMADVTGIYKMPYNGNAGVIRLTFSQPLVTQVFDKGELTNSTSQPYVDFFYKKVIVNKIDKGNTALVHLLADITAKFKQNNSQPYNKFLLMATKNTPVPTYREPNLQGSINNNNAAKAINPIGEDGIFRAVETQPEFPGGDAAFGKFLSDHVRYPSVARENNVQGRVFISFTVEKDGSLSDIKIARDPGSGLGDEALRVLRISPRWKPGTQNGKTVRVQYTVPVNFALNE